MTFYDEPWAWFKSAPLPVVLALCLTFFTSLAAWSYQIEKRQAEDSVKIAVAIEKAGAAVTAAERAEQKLDKANEKLDKLLESVVTVKAALDAEKAKAKKEKK